MAARKKVARSSAAAKRGGTDSRKGAKSAAGRKKAARKKAGSSSSGKSVGGKAAARRKSAGAKASGATRKKPARTRGSSAKAAATTPEFPELEALCALMDRHGLVEVDYRVAPDGTQEYRVSRAGTAAAAAPLPAAPGAPPALPGTEPPAAAGVVTQPPAEPDEELHAFKSPMVGTFYRAPSPEAPAFVSLADSVDSSTVVCIIEAMKVMNEIQVDITGDVVSIEVENGEAVEFGQTLMLLRPR